MHIGKRFAAGYINMYIGQCVDRNHGNLVRFFALLW